MIPEVTCWMHNAKKLPAMSSEKIKVTCPKCKKAFAMNKPAAPGKYGVKCPHCQNVIGLHIRPVPVRIEQPVAQPQPAAPTPPPPAPVQAPVQAPAKQSAPKIKMTCPKCKNPFAIVRPEQPGKYMLKCAHCQGVICLNLGTPQASQVQPKSAATKPAPSTTQKPEPPQKEKDDEQIPLLGKAILTNRGFYAVKEKAVAGVKSLFACPECGEMVMVNLCKPNKYNVKCKHCGTYTIVKVIEEEPKTENAGKVKKPTRKLHSDQPVERGQLMWGKLFRRKRYELRNGSTVIGRNDREQPSDLMFDDPTMSCRSVRIDVDGTDGSCKLSVLHATNPVSVNGISYPEGSSIYLKFNDTLKMGRTVIVYSKMK